jgi:hypothetical protein
MTDTEEEMTDTSNEAVERLIAGSTCEPWEQDAVVMLAALLRERNAECDARTLVEAERDRLRAERDEWRAAFATASQAIQNSSDAWLKLQAERDRLREAGADKAEALSRVAQWAEAYPEDIFPPVDLDAVREKLGDDALFSRLHAEWARRLCKGIGDIARAALGKPGHE